MKRPTNYRDLRPQLDERGLRTLASEMLAKGQDALRVRRSKLGVKRLDFLADFRHVRFLGIEGISSGIEAVKHLEQLSHLSLSRHANLDLGFLNSVSSSIDALHIGGSRCRGAEGIGALTGLRSLTIDEVKGLDGLAFLARLERLEYLQLTSLPGLVTFPDLTAATSLRFVSLTSLPDLIDLRGLAMAPRLETLLVQETPRLPPANLEAFLKHAHLSFIYPCLDFRADAAVNRQAEQLLAPRFGTGLLDAEIPGFSFT